MSAAWWEFQPTDEHPDWWRPGWFTPKVGGYSSQEARQAVGPGWAALVKEAVQLARAAGVPISQVKEKLGALVLYLHHHAPEQGERVRAVCTALDALEHRSLSICEACGAPGRLYQMGETLGPVRMTWMKTLCPPCAWRGYVEGERWTTGDAPAPLPPKERPPEGNTPDENTDAEDPPDV